MCGLLPHLHLPCVAPRMRPLCVDLLHACALYVWTSSTETLHVWTFSTHTPMCGLTPHTAVLCVPFHHRFWHEIRTVWFACGRNVDRIQDKCGLHLCVIRTNLHKHRLHLRGIRAVSVVFGWNIDRIRSNFGSFRMKSGPICHGGPSAEILIAAANTRSKPLACSSRRAPTCRHAKKLPRLLLKHESL